MKHRNNERKYRLL